MIHLKQFICIKVVHRIFFFVEQKQNGQNLKILAMPAKTKRKRTEKLDESEKAIMYCGYSQLRKKTPAPDTIMRNPRSFLSSNDIVPPSRQAISPMD